MSTSPFYLEIPFGLFALQKIGGPLEKVEGTYVENPALEPDKYKGKKVGLAIFEPGKPQYQQTKIPTFNLKMYQKEIPDADEIREKFEELNALIEEARDLIAQLKSEVSNAQSSANGAQSTADQAMQAAQAAQSSADQAQSSANQAQASADQAQSTANAAANSAGSAGGAAQAAQSAANSAQTAIRNSNVISNLSGDELIFDTSTGVPGSERTAYDIIIDAKKLAYEKNRPLLLVLCSTACSRCTTLHNQLNDIKPTLEKYQIVLLYVNNGALSGLLYTLFDNTPGWGDGYQLAVYPICLMVSLNDDAILDKETLIAHLQTKGILAPSEVTDLYWLETRGGVSGTIQSRCWFFPLNYVDVPKDWKFGIPVTRWFPNSIYDENGNLLIAKNNDDIIATDIENELPVGTSVDCDIVFSDIPANGKGYMQLYETDSEGNPTASDKVYADTNTGKISTNTLKAGDVIQICIELETVDESGETSTNQICTVAMVNYPDQNGKVTLEVTYNPNADPSQDQPVISVNNPNKVIPNVDYDKPDNDVSTEETDTRTPLTMILYDTTAANSNYVIYGSATVVNAITGETHTAYINAANSANPHSFEIRKGDAIILEWNKEKNWETIDSKEIKWKPNITQNDVANPNTPIVFHLMATSSTILNQRQ